MKWLVGALLVLAVGAFLRLGYIVYAMYALLGVVLLGRFLTLYWAAHLSVSRDCDREEARIGDTVTVTTTVRNAGKLWIPWVLLEDTGPRAALASVPPRLRRSGDWVAVTKLSPGEEVVFTYEVECLLRGCYPLGPLLVAGGDLFGLYRRFRTVGEPHLVTVLPKVIPLAGWDLRSRKPLGRMRLAHRLFEDPIQVSGIRDYQPGDAMNRIHWRATARTGHLQTKTYDPSCVAGAAILLDFHQASLRGNAELFRTELAITAAASLAHAVLQGGQPTGLFTNGRDGLERLRREGWVGDFRTRNAARRNAQSTAQDDRLRPLAIEPSRTPGQIQRILEMLARLEASDGLAFANLIEEVAGRVPRNTHIVAIVQNLDPEAALLLGGFQLRGYSVTVLRIGFDPRDATPDWARMPEPLANLAAAGADVRLITDEESLASACAAGWA